MRLARSASGPLTTAFTPTLTFRVVPPASTRTTSETVTFTYSSGGSPPFFRLYVVFTFAELSLMTRSPWNPHVPPMNRHSPVAGSQTSVVHGSSSLHVFVANVWHCPGAGLHPSTVHALSSLQ